MPAEVNVVNSKSAKCACVCMFGALDDFTVDVYSSEKPLWLFWGAYRIRHHTFQALLLLRREQGKASKSLNFYATSFEFGKRIGVVCLS